jgi:transglutaminase-like putative cysteine protease
MSTTLEPAPAGRTPSADAPPPAPSPTPATSSGGGQASGPGADTPQALTFFATLALLVAACLPLTRVFVGLAFLAPVLAAVLLSAGLSYAARRSGLDPITSLCFSVGGWVMFCSFAFFADTLALEVLPSPATAEAAVALWQRGLELMRLRPAPAFAEAGLVFITVTGVWAIAHAVEGMVGRLAAPLKATVMALVLWVVPLTLAPGSVAAWRWTVPFLAAAAALLLAFAGDDLGRWGTWVGGRSRRGAATLLPGGSVIALVAIVAGAGLAGFLPGFGQPPWYELRGASGTTLTSNPIVDIRTRLVAQDTGPVMRVRSDRPVYLRVTSLDVYGENEEWTNQGIDGAPLDGDVPFEVAIGPAAQVSVDVEVANLSQAVLVPAPYQALTVSGEAAGTFQYDPSLSTITLDQGTTLEAGDTYTVSAVLPSPDAEQLDAAQSFSLDGALTQLPANVPPAVPALARQIVEAAGADTPFRQALAIQEELRSWEYSTEPPQGHSGQAMEAFINNQIGYCEQYAGTMAVMLRSLNIPARVAVGYTPGELIDREEGTYVVTNANAHAWVEVLFPGLGWVTFEPTPRSDGNVLVPSATNLAPNITAAQGGVDDPERLIPGEERADLVPDDPLDRTNTAPSPAAEAAGSGGRSGAPARALLLTGLALLGIAVLAGGVVAARGRNRTLSPAQRVLQARTQTERIGRGLGVAPAESETDHEYLQRLARKSPIQCWQAADALAEAAARARYATALPPESAAASEDAAERLGKGLLAGVPAWQRPLVRLRGAFAVAIADLSRRRREPSGSASPAASILRRRAPRRPGIADR